MIRNVLVNVGKLFEDRNQRVVDMLEQRLIDQLVDLRAQLAAQDPEVMVPIYESQLREDGFSLPTAEATLMWVQKYELIKAKIEVVDGLIADMNGILQRVHAGA